MAISTTFIDAASDQIAMEMIMSDAIYKLIKATEPIEDKFKPKARAAFTKQEKSVLARMARKPLPELEKSVLLHTARMLLPEIEKAASNEAEAAADAYLNGVFVPKEWQKPFERVVLPFTTQALGEAGEAALVEVGIETGFDVTSPRAKKILQEKAFKFAKEVNITTQDKLRIALAEGLDAGEGIREISGRVSGVFDIARGSRTDTIARTEIVGASNHGTYEGYIESGIVLTNIWVETKDNRTRDGHTAHSGVGGEEVKLTERFSNGLRFPHDPQGSAEETINCRCTHVAGQLKEAA